MQTLKLNVNVTIPDEFVIISKVELEELEKQNLLGKYWSMKDLENHTNKKHEWIKENILYPSRFRKVLDVDNGGFVYYPKSKGQTWSFHALKTAEFLDKHFQLIFSENQ
jgi:phage pi2 protein 07